MAAKNKARAKRPAGKTPAGKRTKKPAAPRKTTRGGTTTPPQRTH
jgi:hypothetical protein